MNFYIKELKKVPTDLYAPGNFDLQTTDIRWSNLCNFSCVYCFIEYLKVNYNYTINSF